MKLSLKDHGQCQKTLTVEVAPEEVAAAREAVYHDLARVARVPGFRVGHAPRPLVEQHYGARAREETIRRVIGEQLPKALQQAKLDLLGDPEVTQVAFDNGQPMIPPPATGPKGRPADAAVGGAAGGGMTFTARCEVMPVVPVRPLRGLKVTRPTVAVTEIQVEEVLTQLREQQAQLKAKPVPPLDEAFAKELGVESVEALRSRVRQDLTQTLAAQARRAAEEQLLQMLLDQTPFEVPPSLLQSQAQRMLRQAQLQLIYQGLPPEEVQARHQLLADQSKRDALRQVKGFFLLRQLAATHGLAATEQEVAQRIDALAAQARRPADAVRAELAQQRLLSELAWDVTRGKIMEFLLKGAEA